ncbi:MAG: ABC transporter permease [Frisingicoccus sp.]
MISTYQNKYAFDGVSREGSGREAVEIDKSIAEKYRGPLTDEKVQQMLADFHTESDINAKYLYQNAMQSAVCARFSDIDGNWNGQTVSDVFGDAKINVGYVDGWLGVSQDMVRIFVFLSLVIIIMIAPVFSGEYGGVIHIILSSKYGKTRCATAKVIAGFAAAIIVTLWILGINTLMAFVLYGNEGMDCSILFAPVLFTEGYIPFNITCGTLLKYQCLLAFTGTVSVAAMTLLFSALSKNQMAALVFSAAAYLFR